MELTATIGGKRYAVHLAKQHDISVPVRFDGRSLAEFGAPPASREAYVTEGFTGDVKKGGSCNCELLTFSPHLHGTHTECVGHIADTSHAVHVLCSDTLIPATLVTILPVEGAHESYDPPLRPTDALITRSALAMALLGRDKAFFEAVIIRTGKHGKEPPFFSMDAISYLNDMGVQHLLADIPSIDRLDDEGKLSNHHLFWGVPQGTHKLRGQPSPKTVTELIRVPGLLADGTYLLNLQVAAFMSDATPSRPVLYEITPV